MIDTGKNIPESKATLMLQQQQLVQLRRLAQMFPIGTDELALPVGFKRVKTTRGVFHYNPMLVSKDEVIRLSEDGRENLLLGLGPYSKKDVDLLNEPYVVVTERTPEGVEVKAALGTPTTAPGQVRELEITKSPGNVIAVEELTIVLLKRTMGKRR